MHPAIAVVIRFSMRHIHNPQCIWRRIFQNFIIIVAQRAKTQQIIENFCKASCSKASCSSYQTEISSISCKSAALVKCARLFFKESPKFVRNDSDCRISTDSPSCSKNRHMKTPPCTAYVLIIAWGYAFRQEGGQKGLTSSSAAAADYPPSATACPD